MLNLIYGTSGAGKTGALIQRIRQDIENKQKCFLLVPEQQAYISERDLPAALPQNAGLYFEVVNFSSLAEDVFCEYGGITQGTLSNSMRNLLMWDTLRSLAPLLKRYGKGAASDTSMTHLMLQAVNELRMNNIDSKKIEESVNQIDADTALREKLSDIALIEAVFHDRNESVFGTDPSDKLLRMATVLDAHTYFQNTNVYIDSFTSFTAQEYAVLLRILKQADAVTVSLCTDAQSSKLPHFESLTETMKRLKKLASSSNTDVTVTQLLPKSARKFGIFDFLEKNIWKFDLRKEALPIFTEEEQKRVQIRSCTNLYEEAEAAALHVLELIHSGMHYGDIAVIVRDTEVYRGVLDAAFERYGIPYFLSEATDLSSKPLSRLIFSALRAVNRHYHVQDIITLVKTGLAGVSVKDAALFEEYCETWHLSGSRFSDPYWSMNPDGLTTDRSERAEEILAAANQARKQIMEPLERLSLDLHVAQNTGEQCRAIYDYLTRLQISEQMTEQAKKELTQGQRREAGETLRTYRILMDALVPRATSLPESRLSTEELLTALTLLFSDTQMSSVPNVHDCVIIGSAATLRVENVKASLLLGLCEGEFPRSQTETGIFTESDKIKLESAGLSFASRENLRASEELFYIYRAVTKPTDNLYLSTVEMQIDGSARTPSIAFNRICYLLTRKPVRFDTALLQGVLEKASPQEWKPQLTIPNEESARLLRLSQSKIRSFVLCPFSYFTSYRLGLREKKDARPSYADDGIFLHHIFERVLKELLREDGTLAFPSEIEVETLANKIVDEYILQVCPLPPEHMDARLLHLFVRLRKLSLIILREILDELSTSGFVPQKFEQKLGDPYAGLPTVTLELKNGSRVVLDGTVDRVDMMREQGRVFVRVVDYKSGEHKFSIDEVRTGLDIQLVLYLYAVCQVNSADTVASGAQYLYATTDKSGIHVNRSGFLLDEESFLQSADRSEGRKHSNKLTLLSQPALEELMQDMQTAIRTVAERILAGEAEKTPSAAACRFCPVRAHCDVACLDERR